MKKILKSNCMVLFLSIMFAGMIFCMSTQPVLAKSVTPKKIVLTTKSKNIFVNEKATLKVKTILPKNAYKKVKWTSSDPDVVTVDANGVITGKSEGSAKITVCSKMKKSVKAVCTIHVMEYGEKQISFTSDALAYNVPGKGNKVYDTYKKLNKVCIVASKKDCTALINYIKQKYPKGSDLVSRDNLVKKLKSYDKSFFDNNTLIYTLSFNDGHNSQYLNSKTVDCIKKYDNGYLTVFVKTECNEEVSPDLLIDSAIHTRFICGFTTVSKSDMNAVTKAQILK